MKWGKAHTSVRCFKCDEYGHRAPECKSATMNYFKCGKLGHCVADCRGNSMTCFKYGE